MSTTKSSSVSAIRDVFSPRILQTRRILVKSICPLARPPSVFLVVEGDDARRKNVSRYIDAEVCYTCASKNLEFMLAVCTHQRRTRLTLTIRRLPYPCDYSIHGAKREIQSVVNRGFRVKFCKNARMTDTDREMALDKNAS